MKFFYLLSACYILLLSVMPCCSDDLPINQVQARLQVTNSDLPGNDDCIDCSPFFGCCSATGFIENIPSEHDGPVVLPVISTINTRYIQSYLPDVSLMIWQPPKLA